MHLNSMVSVHRCAHHRCFQPRLSGCCERETVVPWDEVSCPGTAPRAARTYHPVHSFLYAVICVHADDVFARPGLNSCLQHNPSLLKISQERCYKHTRLHLKGETYAIYCFRCILCPNRMDVPSCVYICFVYGRSAETNVSSRYHTAQLI